MVHTLLICLHFMHPVLIPFVFQTQILYYILQLLPVRKFIIPWQCGTWLFQFQWTILPYSLVHWTGLYHLLLLLCVLYFYVYVFFSFFHKNIAFIWRSESVITGCWDMGVPWWLARCYSPCLHHLCSWKDWCSCRCHHGLILLFFGYSFFFSFLFFIFFCYFNDWWR